jgi:hypothetical protein
VGLEELQNFPQMTQKSKLPKSSFSRAMRHGGVCTNAWRIKDERAKLRGVDESRKRVLGIMASILAARKLAAYDGGKRVPATMSAIADAVRWAEEIMRLISAGLQEMKRPVEISQPCTNRKYGARSCDDDRDSGCSALG